MASGRTRAFYTAVVLTLGLLVPTPGEKVLGSENEEFDFDGLPGAQHEFKLTVGGGMEECLFQKIVSGGKLHVSFEVISGGDRLISINVKDPHSTPIVTTDHETSGYQEVDASVTGDYAICLDNTYSRLSSKLVYIYIVTYVEAEWHQYVKEIEDVHLTVENFTKSISGVQASLQEAVEHQAQSRMHVIKDWYLITGNNKYVRNWSILQCIVIVFSSCFQVYFVRRLFKVVNVTPNAKPRA